MTAAIQADTQNGLYKLLFPLCWLAYFTAYLGRLNYGAAIAEIVVAEGLTNSACGLVSTGFFVCYGAGQLFSGVVGDRVSVKQMIFIGLTVSACCNMIMGFLHSPALMLVVWCLNGLAQSMTWAPILRAFAEYLPADQCKRACVNIATTYPLGTLVTYGFCAVVILLASWRTIFFLTSGLMLAVALVWVVCMGRFEAAHTRQVTAQTTACTDTPAPVAAQPMGRIAFVVLALIGAALAMQGALRDGVMTWIPTYLSNTFSIGTTFSIFATMVLPLVNLSGTYIARFLCLRFNRNELQTGLILFVVSGITAALLSWFGGGSLPFSVAAFSVVTACMTGTNVMLVHIVPTYFVKYGRVSTVSGVVNASVYIGSSLATYGIGVIADLFGWGILLWVLCGIAALGAGFCLIASPYWKRFSGQ